MSWTCHTCSTVNTEDHRGCVVCAAIRPAPLPSAPPKGPPGVGHLRPPASRDLPAARLPATSFVPPPAEGGSRSGRAVPVWVWVLAGLLVIAGAVAGVAVGLGGEPTEQQIEVTE